MSKIILFTLLLFSAASGYTQLSLIRETTDADLRRSAVYNLSEDAKRKYDIQRNNHLVSKITLVKLNPEALKQGSLLINHGVKKVLAKQTKSEIRSGNDYSWFGRLEDETGIFFTVMGDQVVSKFYIETTPYTLLPLEGDVHMLIEYGPNTLGTCLLNNPLVKKQPAKAVNFNDIASSTLATPLPNDNNCNLRVIIAITADAESELATTLAQTAQMLEDEANLAYQQSLVNFRMEIARIVRTSYTEVNTSGTDVTNFQAGVSPLNSVHSLREVYKADVMVLLRKGNFQIGLSTLFGQAYDQPTTSDPPAANEAFCMVTTDFLIGGRFTFAHEIGHLQGAGHDTNLESPNYAKGFIQNNIIGPTRTIMATADVTSCAFIDNGCRIQYFSNPNVNFGSGPMGTVDRDNVRRMNETAPAILNYRTTTENLVVQNETFDNEILANHLGNSTVSTSGTVTALSGSWVTFRSTDEITLTPGFSADNGSEFTATLINNPCAVLPPQDITNATEQPSVTGKTVTDISMDNRDDKTSIQEGIRTYPNPSDNLLNLEFVVKKTTKVSLVITDLAGKAEKSISKNASYKSGVHKITVNTEKLAPGVYIYTLLLDNSRHTGKIVIVH